MAGSAEKGSLTERAAGAVEKKSYFIGGAAAIGSLVFPVLSLVAAGELTQIMYAKTVKENEKLKAAENTYTSPKQELAHSKYGTYIQASERKEPENKLAQSAVIVDLSKRERYALAA